MRHRRCHFARSPPADPRNVPVGASRRVQDGPLAAKPPWRSTVRWSPMVIVSVRVVKSPQAAAPVVTDTPLDAGDFTVVSVKTVRLEKNLKR